MFELQRITIGESHCANAVIFVGSQGLPYLWISNFELLISGKLTANSFEYFRYCADTDAISHAVAQVG